MKDVLNIIHLIDKKSVKSKSEGHHEENEDENEPQEGTQDIWIDEKIYLCNKFILSYTNT